MGRGVIAMDVAIFVLSGFAAAWSYLGILNNGWSEWFTGLPLALSALLIAIAQRRSFPTRSESARRYIRRLLLIWTIAEFVALGIVTNLLLLSHFEHAIAPAGVIIVGAHFVPLARGIPAPLYYATGACLISVGAVALFLAPPLALNVAAFGAAIILWASAIVLLSKGERRAAHLVA